MEVEEKDYFRGHWPLMQFESYGWTQLTKCEYAHLNKIVKHKKTQVLNNLTDWGGKKSFVI
jgi:hypothetical protein